MILCLCPNPSIDKFIKVDDFKAGLAKRKNLFRRVTKKQTEKSDKSF